MIADDRKQYERAVQLGEQTASDVAIVRTAAQQSSSRCFMRHGTPGWEKEDAARKTRAA